MAKKRRSHAPGAKTSGAGEPKLKEASAVAQTAAALLTDPPVPTDGLTLWVMADTGVVKDSSNLVSVWQDQSGNGNDLTASGTAQPQWVEDIFNFYTLPGIRFDGNANVLSAGGAALGADDFTFFAIAIPTSEIRIDSESTSGTDGMTGQSYVAGAGDMGSGTGACVSLGTNGVSVYEQRFFIVSGYSAASGGKSGVPGGERARSIRRRTRSV